jgi:hypothetical protein
LPPTNAPCGSTPESSTWKSVYPKPSAKKVWRESGLGAPADIDTLNQTIARLEQQVSDLRLHIEERDEDLAAARAANRELMARLNAPASSRRT